MRKTKYLYDERPLDGTVSVSQIQTFLSCKKKWEYGYLENLTPRIDRAYLTIGKLCHKGMQSAMQQLWKMQQNSAPHKDDLEVLKYVGVESIHEEMRVYMNDTPLLDEEISDIKQMYNDACNVFSQALSEFDPTKYEVVQVKKDEDIIPALELHFLVPCVGSKGLHGYIDAILKDKETGFTWCVDYKFRKSLSPDEDESFNIQNAVYSYACMKMGIDITGTMTWQHINTPASDPKINKDGSVSTAKIKTTWEHYKDFLKRTGHDPNDPAYADMEEKLADIEWCRATYEYRNEETIKEIWNSCVVPVAKEIRKAGKPKYDHYRSLYPWNCKMCQYQSLCQAELRDYDVSAIRAREYVYRKHVRK